MPSAALEVSAHHVFVGDSTGWLHLHKQDIPRPGQLARLVHSSRVRVPASDAPTPIVGCQYLPFCQGTQSPALLVTARDSTLAVVRIAKEVRPGGRAPPVCLRGGLALRRLGLGRSPRDAPPDARSAVSWR